MIDQRREAIAYLCGLFTGLSLYKFWFIFIAILFLILAAIVKDVNCTKDEGGQE